MMTLSLQDIEGKIAEIRTQKQKVVEAANAQLLELEHYETALQILCAPLRHDKIKQEQSRLMELQSLYCFFDL